MCWSPLVIALVGNWYTAAIKEAENRVKYTELAISILKDSPEEDKNEVREWAVDVINQYSGVPMSDDVKKQMIGTRLVASIFSDSDFTDSDFQGSNFNGANFSDSVFDNAYFRDAIFGSARMSGADFRGADLSEAIIDGSTVLPPQK